MADLHVREKKLARVAPLSGPSVTIIILCPGPADTEEVINRGLTSVGTFDVFVPAHVGRHVERKPLTPKIL